MVAISNFQYFCSTITSLDSQNTKSVFIYIVAVLTQLSITSCHMHMASVHIVGQIANRYIIIFHISILRHQTFQDESSNTEFLERTEPIQYRELLV